VRPFEVHVPCSTSNLGAGFDALGLALGGLSLRVQVRPGGSGLRIADLHGEGRDALPRDERNRVIVAARAAAERAGRPLPAALAAEIEVHNDIPLQRGLGSSAAAALAGALLADALLEGALGEQGALAVAVQMEGHPDNVVPALRGGAQVAVRDAAGAVLSCPVRMAVPLAAALFIPDQPLATAEARAVLPQRVTLQDAVHNLGRSALWVAALSAGRVELIAEAMRDRLHQPARSQLMPWLPELIEAALRAGAHGAALSGAGTTVCALCPPARAEQVAAALRSRAEALHLAGRALAVEAGAAGARVVREG
jgi:homoserine kinase